MIRRTLKSGLLATLICATILAVTGFPKAQNKPLHPLEGLYEVSLNDTDIGEGLKFLVSLTRDGDKWVGAVRETPFLVTVNEVTVTGENSLTGIATANARGVGISFTVKVEGSKITCNGSDGKKTATLTATKKATEGKVTATVEGTYQGRAGIEGENPFSVELIIKRMNPSNK